jgi:hypothetical protein
MSGNDLVRAWKDPDERGDAAHPAGDISLDDLSGAGEVRITVVSVQPANCLETLIWPRCPHRSFAYIACAWTD